MNIRHLYDLARKAVLAWVDDMAPSMGAAIAYYTMFSLAPLLVIVIAIAGAVFGRDAVQGQIAAQLGGLIGHDSALAVQGLVRSAGEHGGGFVAGAIGVVVLLVGATSVFSELQSALDRIWHVPERDKPSGLWAIVKARLLSFGLILGLAFLLMVSLVTSAAVAALGSWAGSLIPGWEVLLQGLNLCFSLLISCLLFAMIFKLMPTAPVAWADVWIGSAVTAVLFEIGKLLIALYIGRSGLTQTFAAAGSVVVLLAWVYYAAQIFLLGAEFTKVYASEHGSATGGRAMAATHVGAAQAAAGTAQLAPGGAAAVAKAAQASASERSPQTAASAGLAASVAPAGAAASGASADAAGPAAGIPAIGTLADVEVARNADHAELGRELAQVDRRIARARESLLQRLVLLSVVSVAEMAVRRFSDRRRKRMRRSPAR